MYNVILLYITDVGAVKKKESAQITAARCSDISSDISSDNCGMGRTYRKRTRNILLLPAAEAPSPAHFTKVARAAGGGQLSY
jgi:hypothetical protein